MPDVYAQIRDVDDAVVAQLAAAMELRATDPVQRGFVDEYLGRIELHDARVLEIGCGTGAISRLLAGHPDVAAVVGVDPSPALVDRARALGADVPGLTFEVGDGRSLPVDDDSFDAVVLHTVLSHVPGPEAVLREAHRALHPGGAVAIFDGDYTTITFAVADDDPLEACANEFRRSYIHDPWVMRQMPALVRAAGFDDARVQSHGYVQVQDANYMLSVLARGAAALAARGVVSAEHADALNQEAARRLDAGTFFGHIAYVSVTARRAD